MRASKPEAMLERVYTVSDLEGMEGEYELDEGRLVPVTPRPQRRHCRVCARFTIVLGNHCDATSQGEVLSNDAGFLLQRDPDTLRGPDVAVMRSARLEGLPEDCWPEGAPDLVVEVVSPGDSPGPLQTKVGQYLQAGAEIVWVAYPARRTVVVYEKDGSVSLLGPDQELTAEPVLPGFRCRVGDLM